MAESFAPVAFLLVVSPARERRPTPRVLEPRGTVRLSVDELVFQRHGRYGIDYPENTYFEKEAPVVAELHRRLAELVAEGREVVWDHGLWPRKDREAMKGLVESAGGRWRLLYFPVGRDERLRRLAERNERGDAKSLLVTSQALDDVFGRFEESQGGGRGDRGAGLTLRHRKAPGGGDRAGFGGSAVRGGGRR
ncbi:AAA family ATPase [Streptomyces sp. WC2508]|uniref:AAA family ATPase n=1 Tax=Streptomyces sp. WC2508 TaxID=3461405 RepID=UPI004044E55D